MEIVRCGTAPADRHRDACPRRGRGHRSSYPEDQACARRQPSHAAITLVIDQNPAPMAAKFELGPDANVTEISTRVRVNSYTDVHAVAELSDGQLYMVKTYVKASGGCSAPAAKMPTKPRLGLAG